MRSILILAAAVLFAFSFKTPENQTKTNTPVISQVKWLQWDEAIEKSTLEKKKFFIHMYSSDCEWSKHMDETTFQDEEIVQYLNSNFYPIKMDIKSQESIKFNDQVYKSTKEGDVTYHELVLAITNGDLTTPAFAFLDEDKKLIQSLQGYKNTESFEKIMTYIGGNHFKKKPWTSYQSEYIPLQPARLYFKE